MSDRIGIMGVGAVGSYLGAFLTREGHDVTLIDMWGQHVDTMKRDGLSVSGTQGEFNVPVNALHLAEAQQIKEPFDIGFLCVKSYDTEWAAHFFKRYISATGVVVSAQNCMNDQLVASIVGYQNEIGCVMSSISVALWEPGHVHRGGEPGASRGHDVFRVGELHGKITDRVLKLVEMVSCIDGARATSNIWGERWSKLTMNSSSNPISSMMGLGSQGVANNAGARRLQVHICKESAQVGQALNYDIESVSGIKADVWANADQGDVYEELEARFMPKPGAPDWKSSMAQDVTKGRLTETEYMNGYIVDRGREMGIPTPVNAAIVEVLKDIDAGRIQPDPSNVERTLAMAGFKA